MTEIIFENIKTKIQAELRKAKDSIFIAVAWFTDEDLFDIVIDCSKKGIQVQIIINDDEINENSGLDYSLIFKNGGMVFFVDSKEVLMHNKFCIIDEKIVLNGSYNWTRKANSNFENITIIRDTEISGKFLDEFKKLKNLSEKQTTDSGLEISFENGEELSYDELIERANKRKTNENYLSSFLDFKKAFLIDPYRDKSILFDMAYCQSKLNNTIAALENYNSYLEIYPDDSGALNNRGLIYEVLRKDRLGIWDFNKAIEIDNSKAIYFYNRARIVNNLIGTSRTLPRIHCISSDFNTLENYHKYLEQKKESDFSDSLDLKQLIQSCVDDYLKVIELDKKWDKIEIYENIAELYYNQGYYSSSALYYTKQINIISNDHYSFYNRAWCYYMDDLITNSINDIEQALKIKPYEKSYLEAKKIFKKEKMKMKNWFK